MDQHPLEHYKEHVMPYINSKKEEFQLFGYEHIDANQIWNILKQKKWKKNSEEKPLYEIVNDILHLTIGEYMNHVQIEAYKSPNWFK